MGLKPESVTPARLAEVNWWTLASKGCSGPGVIIQCISVVTQWCECPIVSHAERWEPPIHMLTTCQCQYCCILGHFMKFTANWWYYLIHKFKSGIKRSPAVPGTFCWRERNLINMNKTQLPDKLCPISEVSQLSVLQNHCRNTAVTLWI